MGCQISSTPYFTLPLLACKIQLTVKIAQSQDAYLDTRIIRPAWNSLNKTQR
jgi:hypothetical protein